MSVGKSVVRSRAAQEHPPGTRASSSLVGWSSGAALFVVVVCMTEAIRARLLSVGPFAATAARVAAGQLWLLFSSGLVVDRPVTIGLIAFGLIASVTLWVCGARTFWVAAIAGHVGSTLLVYAIIGLSRLTDPHLFSAAVASPDFGVSAMQGAWGGALTARAGLACGRRFVQRAATVAGVCVLGGVAWLLHPDPSILTFEHLFAFAIGSAIVWFALRRAPRPVPSPALSLG